MEHIWIGYDSFKKMKMKISIFKATNARAVIPPWGWLYIMLD